MIQCVRISLRIYFLELKLQVELYRETSHVTRVKIGLVLHFWWLLSKLLLCTLNDCCLIGSPLPSSFVTPPIIFQNNFIHSRYWWLLNQPSDPIMYIQLPAGHVHLDDWQTSHIPQVHSELIPHQTYPLLHAVFLTQ